jgi:hypothetical protein
MRAVLVLWELSSGSNVTIAELRDYLRNESIARFRQLQGLRQKTWVSNEAMRTWGAMYLFETREQADALVEHVAEGRAAELIGLQPRVQEFDVEAVVEGRHAGTELLAAGLAWQKPGSDP